MVWVQGTNASQAPFEVAGSVNLAEVLKKAGSEWSLPASELVLCHSGRLLPSDGAIPTTIPEGGRIFVLRRAKEEGASSSASRSLGPGEIEQLAASVQSCLSDGQMQPIFMSIVRNSSSLLSSVVGLRSDATAQAILGDALLLFHTLISEDAANILREHPSIADGLRMMLDQLHSDASRRAASGEAFLHDPDPLFDDEDDEDGEAQQQPPPHPLPGGGGAVITPAALAAALAAAGAPNLAPAQPQPPPSLEQSPAFRAGMAELAGMGFTDEAECRRALLASGGNVTAALEAIIAAREAQEAAMGLD